MATAKDRKRRYDDRKRQGIAVVSIEVESATIAALQEKGYLEDAPLCGSCTDKAVLAKAIQIMHLDWTIEALEEFEDAEAAGEEGQAAD